MMTPGIVQPDPRAYVRIAAMVREMISSLVLPDAEDCDEGGVGDSDVGAL